MCLVSAFFQFPTHPHLYYHCFASPTHTQTQPGRGEPVEGVHPPSPSTFTPWSSRRHVVCFHAPPDSPRLPVSVNASPFTCDGVKIHKKFGLVCHGPSKLQHSTDALPTAGDGEDTFLTSRTTRTFQFLGRCLDFLLNPFFGVTGSIHWTRFNEQKCLSGILLHSSR